MGHSHQEAPRWCRPTNRCSGRGPIKCWRAGATSLHGRALCARALLRVGVPPQSSVVGRHSCMAQTIETSSLSGNNPSEPQIAQRLYPKWGGSFGHRYREHLLAGNDYLQSREVGVGNPDRLRASVVFVRVLGNSVAPGALPSRLCSLHPDLQHSLPRVYIQEVT